jgi:hypothetical protein
VSDEGAMGRGRKKNILSIVKICFRTLKINSKYLFINPVPVCSFERMKLGNQN